MSGDKLRWMQTPAVLESCPGCGLVLPVGDGGRHAYLGASAACWALYEQLLEREYSNPRYMRVHRITVDSYAAQHPGKPQPKTIQSINVHLVGLYLALELRSDLDHVRSVIGKLTRRKERLRWLEPPPRLGRATVLDPLQTETPEAHAEEVRRWGRSVWQAWSLYHEDIARLAQST